MADQIWQLIIGAAIMGIIFMLVRPGAPSGKAITDTSNALSSLISTATQYKAGNTQ
jgi:hypothetical protein